MGEGGRHLLDAFARAGERVAPGRRDFVVSRVLLAAGPLKEALAAGAGWPTLGPVMRGWMGASGGVRAAWSRRAGGRLQARPSHVGSHEIFPFSGCSC